MRSPIPPQPEHHSLSSSESWGNPPEFTVTKKLKHSIWNELPIFANLSCLQSSTCGGKIFICNCCFSSIVTSKKEAFFRCCIVVFWYTHSWWEFYLFIFVCVLLTWPSATICSLSLKSSWWSNHHHHHPTSPYPPYSISQHSFSGWLVDEPRNVQ